jgi:hypothetical protein
LFVCKTSGSEIVCLRTGSGNKGRKQTQKLINQNSGLVLIDQFLRYVKFANRNTKELQTIKKNNVTKKVISFFLP